jgi:hypothetical protein
MRCGLGQMLTVLNAALAHDIEEQDAALCRIHQIFEDGCKKTGHRIARCRQLFGRHAQSLTPVAHHQDYLEAEATIDIGQGSLTFAWRVVPVRVCPATGG